MTEFVEQLSCQELVELVTDYLEGALPAADRARFDEHLAICEGCRMYVEQMRTTLRVTGELKTDALSPEAEAALRQAFLEWSAT